MKTSLLRCEAIWFDIYQIFDGICCFHIQEGILRPSSEKWVHILRRENRDHGWGRTNWPMKENRCRKKKWWKLFWNRSVWDMPTNSAYSVYIWILLFFHLRLGILYDLFPPCFPTKAMYIYVLYHMCIMLFPPTHHLELIAPAIFVMNKYRIDPHYDVQYPSRGKQDV